MTKKPLSEAQKASIEKFKSYQKPFTSENARERQAKGVIQRKKNQELRKIEEEKKKNMKQELLLLLSLAMRKGVPADSEDFLSLEEMEGQNISIQTAINIAMIQRALMGDVQAAQYIRDTTGQKPTDKVELDQSLTIEAWAKNHDVEL